MNPSEKKEFSNLITKAGNRVARTVGADIVDAYYDDLKDFPLDLIERAISHAYHDRNPEDEFLKTKMVSSIEIENAANRIVEEESQKEHAKCPKCGGLAWIAEKRAIGQLVAHPCECLFNRASEALLARGKSSRDRMNRRHWEAIVRSYEAYQRR